MKFRSSLATGLVLLSFLPGLVRHAMANADYPDFNGDGIVNLTDLSNLAQYWLQQEPSVDIAPSPLGDQIINLKDLAVLAEHWLEEYGEDSVVLLIKNAPDDRLAAARVDLTPALQYAGIGWVSLEDIRAFDPNGQEVPFQLLPDGDFDPATRVAGTVLFKLPKAGDSQLRLEFGRLATNRENSGTVTVRTQSLEITHKAWRTGGLPCEIRFLDSNTVLDNLEWWDAACHQEWGCYQISYDSWGEVEEVANGPLCTVVRVSAHYTLADGSQAPSRPEATYYWCYFHDRPLVLVTVCQRQDWPAAWGIMRFLELHPGYRFWLWAGGEPFQEGQLTGSGTPYTFGNWAAVSDGRVILGMLDSGVMRIYDGRGTSIDTYLLAHKNSAMAETERTLSGWLVIGRSDAPWDFVQAVDRDKPLVIEAVATPASVHSRIQELESDLLHLSPILRRWRLAKAYQLEALGQFDEALRIVEGGLPDGWYFIEAGELRGILEQTGDNFRLLSLLDLATGTEFLEPTSVPLFRINLQNLDNKDSAELRADPGCWSVVRCKVTDEQSWLIEYESPVDLRLTGATVAIPIDVDDASNRIRLGIRVQGVPMPWAVVEVKFPQFTLADHGPQTCVLFPQGSGRVLNEPFGYRGRYPSGSASMPYFAVYDSQGKAGLYVGTHDPWASWRDILIVKNTEPGDIGLNFTYPAPNSDQPGNDFQFPGEAVWQVFRGDWYDATLIYRDWVQANAKWYPKLSENGREDTPLWMRELPVWIRSYNHGSMEQDVSWANEFKQYVGLPTGLRWYGWSDSHYHPIWPDFLEAVSNLQTAIPPFYIMPYMDGIYWLAAIDGVEDAYFADVLRPGVIKKEDGLPHLIVDDEDKTTKGVMCPASSIWSETLQEIVLRMTREYGMKAVYIDGIANLPPQLCFDHSHGHPTGGGDWWVRGHWKTLEDIRRTMPPDCILTTESNAEAYVHVFDGFLVQWEWNGNVPAFPAIYGGAIQMFGRIYNFADRPTKVLAHRMQAGQAFVFGEQTGGALRLPAILQEPESLDFLTQIARLRWGLRRFFYAGQMARPPKLYGSIPTVTADWGNGADATNWVTMDAVLTGAWRIPRENRLVLLFVNVSDHVLRATLDFDAAAYGLPSQGLKATAIVADVASQAAQGRFGPPSPGKTLPIASAFQRQLYFPPRFAWAWVIEP
jgi:hypothetical protein